MQQMLMTVVPCLKTSIQRQLQQWQSMPLVPCSRCLGLLKLTIVATLWPRRCWNGPELKAMWVQYRGQAQRSHPWTFSSLRDTKNSKKMGITHWCFCLHAAVMRPHIAYTHNEPCATLIWHFCDDLGWFALTDDKGWQKDDALQPFAMSYTILQYSTVLPFTFLTFSNLFWHF